MLNLRLLSKKYFSQIAKVKFVSAFGQNVKNLIYFVPEQDLKLENKSNNQLIEYLKQTQGMRLKDLTKNKYGIIYPWSTGLMFTERMCLVVTPSDDFNKIRSVTSKAFKEMSSKKVEDVQIFFDDKIPLHHRRIAINTCILSNYKFKVEGNPKQDTEEDQETAEENTKKNGIVKNIEILADNAMQTKIDSFAMWVNMANASLYTRNLANTRPNIADCDYFEEIALKLYNNNKNSSKLSIEVIKGDQLKEKGMNLIHAVGKAAESAPRMIILTYEGHKESKVFTHAVVGKGLTFDTGGLNLKPTGFIEDMYLDKHGACNTLSIFKTVVESKLPINLVCAIGVADNAIGSKAYKPSDIIKSYKGYTVEITNTDAEGRLVLVDTLSYVQEKYKPLNVIDLATLTGACMVALGNKTAGLFTNNTELAGEISAAADEVLEPLWHLPINDEHRDELKSSFADMKNSGKDRYGGASKGAGFIERFIEKDTNWVHLDIAG
jgi:leucyl aminopeptidase